MQFWRVEFVELKYGSDCLIGFCKAPGIYISSWSAPSLLGVTHGHPLAPQNNANGEN